MQYQFDIDPVPCARPRVTRRGVYYPERYRQFKQGLSLLGFGFAFKPGSEIEIKFHIPVKNKKLWNQAHTKKPDIDNLIKGVLDALYEDDGMVHTVKASKFYSELGRIEVYVKD